MTLASAENGAVSGQLRDAPPSAPTSTSPSPDRTRSKYLPTLDGWRAVAILMVIWGHAQPSLRELRRVHDNSVLPFAWDGGMSGVQIFFGLSGLLICSRLLEEYTTSSGINLKRFYIRRVHRILPAAIVTLGIFTVLGISGRIVFHTRDWVVPLFLGANYALGLSGFVGHFWSLSMEEHFYLLFPPLLALAGARRTLWIAAGLAIAVAIWRQIDSVCGVTFGHYINEPWYRTDGGCDGLLWGCVAALVFHRAAPAAWIRQHLKGWLLVVPVAIFVALFRIRTLPQSWALVSWGLKALMVPIVLLGTITHPTSWVGRLLECPPLRWVGRLSYSLYLWQQLFLIDKARWSPAIGWMQTWPISIVCVFSAGCASYYLIERPLVREGYRLTRKPEEQTHTPVAGSLAQSTL